MDEPPAQLAIAWKLHHGHVGPAPPQDLLTSRFSCNIKLLKARSAQLLLAMLAVASGGLRPPRRRPPGSISLRRRFMAGAGLGTPQFGPKPWSRAGAPLGNAWLPDGSVLIQPSVRPPAPRARWGARFQRPIFRGARGAARGKGGCGCGKWIPDCRAQPFHYLATRAGELAPTARRWRAPSSTASL